MEPRPRWMFGSDWRGKREMGPGVFMRVCVRVCVCVCVCARARAYAHAHTHTFPSVHP
jgi:hypothetical protein